MKQFVAAIERPLMTTEWLNDLRDFSNHAFQGAVTIYEQGFVLDIFEKRALTAQNVVLDNNSLANLMDTLGASFRAATRVPATGITYLEPVIKTRPWPLIMKVPDTATLVAEHDAVLDALRPCGLRQRGKRRFDVHIGEIVGLAFAGETKVNLRHALSDRCAEEVLLGPGRIVMADVSKLASN